MSRVRVSIDISLSTLRKLILVSASKDTSRTAWLKNLCVDVVDSEYPNAEVWLEQEAANVGSTRDEVERSILERNGFNFEEYRQEVVKGGES